MKHSIFTGLAAIFVTAAATGFSPTGLAAEMDYAEHTPAESFHTQGSRAYHSGNYGRAMANFRRAAKWADKLSQHNIGVMYYLGQGVEKDLPRALAWFRLAAERHYPQIVEMVRQVESELDEAAIARAETILEEELLPEYGDAAAVPRTARRMERERRRATGSRTGAVGALTVIDRTGKTRMGHEFYDKDKWDFYRIVEFETELFDGLSRGRVELGDFEVDEESGDSGSRQDD